MTANRTVKIDAFPASAFRYLDRDAVVCIDVMSTSTTIVTAAAQGREIYPVAGVDEALTLAAQLPGSLVAVEQQGDPVRGDMPNSPAALSRRSDASRPLILAGAAGTQLLLNAAPANAVYVACLRNLAATAAHIAAEHTRVVVLGAGWGSDFRCEDEIAAARLAGLLGKAGFAFEDLATADLVARWGECETSFVSLGRSAAYLRRHGLQADVDFILSHVDDLDLVCSFRDGVASTAETPALAAGDNRGIDVQARVLPFRLTALSPAAV